MLTQKQIIRVANLLYKKLKKDKTDLVIYKNMSGRALIEKIETYNKCLEHNYRLAANKISEHINIIVDRICDEAFTIKGKLKELAVLETKCGISPKNLMEDLNYLNQSYPSVEFKKGKLTVKTNEIELEDIALGRFIICLNLSEELNRTDNSLRIEAETPNPASRDNSIIHPHIQDKILCTGEGFRLLKDAISQGRIEDFFKIVDSILHTYNESSAYAPLSEWEGTPCGVCSSICDEDNLNSCCNCDSIMCDGCSLFCNCCESSYCAGCYNMTSCNYCEESMCGNCAADNILFCEKCESNICNDCNKECEICKITICKNCVVECEICDKLICREHIKFCQKCKCGMCESCEERCENCGLDLCEECHEVDECNILSKLNK